MKDSPEPLQNGEEQPFPPKREKESKTALPIYE
jgi:hypothetical protein